jgi:hypothetical protein
MQGLILVLGLVFLFLLVGLNVDEETSPVRLLMLGAIVVMSGWYLLF